MREKLIYLLHFRPFVLAAGILIPWGLFVWWLTGEWSPLP